MRPFSSLDCSRRCIASAFALLVAACGGITASRGNNADPGTGGTSSDRPDGTTSTGGAVPSDPVPHSKASCVGLAATCGPRGNEDCCTSPLVTGGTFYERYDAADGGGFHGRSPATTVSDFRLDKFETTVGRFRKFTDAYSQNMIPAGAGKNPNDPNDPGWDAKWTLGLLDSNGNLQGLPADATALATAVGAVGCDGAWTPNVGANENRPMTCINWYEAFAFCIWDGGRLPTEAEWNYTAAGGSEQRMYPWGAAAPDCTYANYYGPGITWLGGPGFCVLPGIGSTNDVGSESPKGNGRWGHADLAGNVWEWTLDPGPVTVSFDKPPRSGDRVVRGGGYRCERQYLTSLSPGDYNVDPTVPHSGGGGDSDYTNDPGQRAYDSGVGSRCARSAP